MIPLEELLFMFPIETARPAALALILDRLDNRYPHGYTIWLNTVLLYCYHYPKKEGWLIRKEIKNCYDCMNLNIKEKALPSSAPENIKTSHPKSKSTNQVLPNNPEDGYIQSGSANQAKDKVPTNQVLSNNPEDGYIQSGSAKQAKDKVPTNQVLSNNPEDGNTQSGCAKQTKDLVQTNQALSNNSEDDLIQSDSAKQTKAKEVLPKGSYKIHQCTVCKAYQHRDKSIVLRHTLACRKVLGYPKRTHQCESCKMKFPEEKSLERHIRMRKCKLIIENFKQSHATEISYHPEAVKKYGCTICKQYFGKDKYAVVRHLDHCLRKAKQHQLIFNM